MWAGSRVQRVAVAAVLLLLPGRTKTAAASTVSLSIDASNRTHRLRELDLGCHSDTGYSHQPMGLHAQRIYGPSFEEQPVDARGDGTGWIDVSEGGGAGGATLDTNVSFHGLASQRLSMGSGGGRVAVANRGLGNEGLYFEANKTYDGYLFVKSAEPTELALSIETWTAAAGSVPRTAQTLASVVVNVTGGADWQQVNYSLLTNSTANCTGITAGGDVATAANITCPVNVTYSHKGSAAVSDTSAHVCVMCSGQFTIALKQAGTVNLDFVYLAPGEWGRFKGLPVLKEGVQWLQDMGTKLFRMGGSFCSGNNYFWKRWRGLPWTRPSATAHWGHDFEGGWGPFEMVDMANAMGAEAVITTFAVGDVLLDNPLDPKKGTRPLTPQDMGDLVEYSFGNESTAWGKMRIETDRHPAIYNWSYIELGTDELAPAVCCLLSHSAVVSALSAHHVSFTPAGRAFSRGTAVCGRCRQRAVQPTVCRAGGRNGGTR